MIIRSEKTLKLFRGPGLCAWCGARGQTREAAHVFACGMGSGSRLDIRINLVSLGLGGWVGVRCVCNCHGQHHDGKEPTRGQLLALVARRERCTPLDIESVIRLINRIDNVPHRLELLSGLDSLDNARQRTLFWGTLREHNKLSSTAAKLSWEEWQHAQAQQNEARKRDGGDPGIREG